MPQKGDVTQIENKRIEPTIFITAELGIGEHNITLN